MVLISAVIHGEYFSSGHYHDIRWVLRNLIFMAACLFVQFIQAKNKETIKALH